MNRSLSIYLDVLRFSAATWVFLAHASQRLPFAGLPDFGRTADDAVMVFFVLSGFVIAYTSAEKNAGLRDYFAARLSRLYSVAVPALLLAFLVDAIGREVAPALHPSWHTDAPLWRMLAGLLFVNELWFWSVPTPSDPPYWSIGYEFWYYVIFGGAFYLSGARRVLAVAAAAVIAGPKILLLAPVWLMGVGAYRLLGRIGPRLGVALLAGSVIAYIAVYWLDGRPALAWRTNLLVPAGVGLGWSSEFGWKLLIGSIATAHVIGFGAIAPHLSLRAVERPVRWLAGMTFSVYLFHYPLLLLVVVCSVTWRWAEWPEWITALVLFGVLTVIAALAELSERRKTFFRRLVVNVISPGLRQTA